MFKKSTVRTFAIVAMILSAIGLLLSVIGAIYIAASAFVFALGIASWLILLWASILGYKLCSSYNLYEEEYKKVGIRIYAIIVAFVLFFFIGLVVGLVLSVVILATLWGLKRNYDEWDNSDPVPTAPPEDHN